MLINSYCRNKGWLFADLQHLFSRAGAVATEEPLPNADAWICIRTDEWEACPQLGHLVLQVHDMWSHVWPHRVGAVVRSNPHQRKLERCAYDLVRPLGALALMTPTQSEGKSNEAFTVGWVGRPASRNGVCLRSPQPLVEAVRHAAEVIPIHVMLLGSGLEFFKATIDRIKNATCEYYDRDRWPVGSYPELYAQMDVLAITSASEAGPMPLFEALACGVPVISTHVGWAPYLLNGLNGWCYDDNLGEELLKASVAGNLFAPKDVIRRSLGGWFLDGPGGWIEQNMNLARILVETAR